jgi:hypothetical protein
VLGVKNLPYNMEALMTDETKPILCGKCEVPLEIPANADAESTVRCPSCGISEKLKSAAAEAGRFLADHKAQLISKTLRDIGRRNKHLKVTTKPVKKRHYRFKIKL